MIRAIGSYFTTMRAVRRFGRASRLRGKGRNREALALAQEALDFLRRPGVIRTNPAESAAISCATMLVEDLAQKLDLPGTAESDIVDTLSTIRANGNASEFQSWVPYLEGRPRKGSASAV